MPDPRPMPETPPRRAVRDDGDYMSIWEFARLPAEAHHAVWKAHAEHRIDAIPQSEHQPNGIQRYHAAQVRQILRELAAIR